MPSISLNDYETLLIEALAKECMDEGWTWERYAETRALIQKLMAQITAALDKAVAP